MLTLIQKHWPQYAPFVFSAVGGFLAVLISIAAFRVMRWQRDHTAEWDDDTIQRMVRDWADSLGGAVQKLNDPVCLFNYSIQLKESETALGVVRMVDKPKYLHLISQLALTGGHVATFAALSEEERRSILAELKIEVSRLGLAYTGFAPPLNRMSIILMVPISAELSEYRFLSSAQRATSTVVLLRQIIQSRLGGTGLPEPPQISIKTEVPPDARDRVGRT